MANTLRLVRDFTSFSDVTFTPSTEDSEFPATNLRDPLRSKVWRSTAVSSQEVIVDLKTQEDVDSFAVFFRANQPVRLTGGATIKIEGNASPSFGSPLFSATVSLDNESQVISHFLTTAESHRYWRLFIDDPGNPYGGVEVSKFVVGKAEKFDGVTRGFKWSNIDASNTQRTPFGQQYSDILPTRKRVQFELPVESFDNMERLLEFYQAVGITESFLFSLDPEEAIWGEKDRFLMWGNFSSTFEATDVPATYFTMPFTMDEQL